MNHSHSRRNFLQFSTLAGLGLSLNPLSSILKGDEDKPVEESSKKLVSGQQRVTILQTTDVHCQLHPHDELFWENNEMKFRTTGGSGHVAT